MKRFFDKVQILLSTTPLLFFMIVAQNSAVADDPSSSESAASAAAMTSGTPQLTITQSIYNFGSVVQGTKVEHDFELQNTGNGSLVIKSVQPGCGCTAADVEQNTLAPNQKTSLKATFDTSGFQGYKVKTIRIHTNDPAQPSMVVGFQGTVRMDVVLDQSRIYFGPVTRGQISPQTFTIAPEEGSHVTILDIAARSDFIQLDDESIDGGGRKVTVGLKNTIPLGNFRGRIVVKTTSDRNPVVSIPVFARVEGDLQLEPPDVSFGLLEGPLGKPVSQKFRLINKGNQDVHILSTQSSNAAVNVAVNTVKPGKEYQVEVSVNTDTVGPLRGQIKIHTDHPNAEESDVTVPVYGVVTRKGA